MKLVIKKIRLKELEHFVNSERYKEFETVPITPDRVLSYINNPNSNPNDVVLFMGMLGEQLVAFRTIFADKLQSDNQIIRFGWCSGNWVHPGFRRIGFSEELLNEAHKDWDGKLMFTNYAPNSESLYLKTGWFHQIYQFNGVRAYLFPKLAKLNAIFQKRKLIRFLAFFADPLVFLISWIRLKFYNLKKDKNLNFVEATLPDTECFELNNKSPIHTFFERSNKELNWIFSYPWISKKDHSYVLKYPFSSFSESFSYYTIKIFDRTKFIGFFIFSVRKGVLKTLYFNVPDGMYKNIATFIKQFCKQNKIEIVTIYNSVLANELYIRKKPFLYVRRYGQKIYSSFEIKNNNSLRFQDGDGDVIFT